MRCKFNTVRRVLADRIVVLVDDSIVRGTTSKQLVKMVRDAGARQVHFRVASPPVISPCFYGMDFPSRQELLANSFAGRGADASSRAAMAAWLGADSLEYLSADGLLACAGMDQMKMTLPNARDAICAANAPASITAVSAPALESTASAAPSAGPKSATVKKLEIRIDGDESTASSASSSLAVPLPKPHIPSWCTACFSAVYPVPISELTTPVAGCASKDW